MCTILVLYRAHPAFPLIVAANRDEFYGRPTLAPRLVEPTLLAGLDGERGGTWMGATAGGFFVGLTNHRNYKAADKARRSRGEVVMEALRLGEIAQVEALMAELSPSDYNPFQLLYGDAGALRVAYVHEKMERPETHAVSAGFHVLPNDRLDAPSFGHKIERAKARLEGWEGLGWPALAQRLRETLGDGALPPLERVAPPPAGSLMPHAMLHRLEALCIRTPVYGTRSATLAAFAPGRTAVYEYADGPPDEAAFVDLAPLLPA